MAVLVDVGKDHGEAAARGYGPDVLVAGVAVAEAPGAEGGAGVASGEAAGVGDGHAELDGVVCYVVLGVKLDLWSDGAGARTDH